MSTNENNTYTPVQTRSQKKKTRKSGVKSYPFNSTPTKPLRSRCKTIKRVKNSPNTLIALGKKEKESIIKVEYMHPNILKDIIRLKVLYTPQMINELIEDDYWWEYVVMNTFLSILLVVFTRNIQTQ